MTTEHEASRTLVKSTPELWAECSDAVSLARHLDQFGEIRITKLEPETAVAWEGEEVSGTVRLETSGWGTRVTMTARREEPDEAPPPPADEPVPPVAEPDPEPDPDALPPAARAPVEKPGLFARLLRMFKGEPPPLPEMAIELEQPAWPGEAHEPGGLPEPPEPPEPVHSTEVALTAALESLGQAHHRPFSRA